MQVLASWFLAAKSRQIAAALFVTVPHRSAQGTPTSTTASSLETRKKKIKIVQGSAARCCCLTGRSQILVAQFFELCGVQDSATRGRHFEFRRRTPHRQRATQQLRAAWKREREKSASDLSLLSERWQLTTCPNFRRSTVWRSRHSHPQPPLHFLPRRARRRTPRHQRAKLLFPNFPLSDLSSPKLQRLMFSRQPPPEFLPSPS